ncbi:MAG: FtsX-like permease family protein [Lachnospiraceae bacterium]|nr:FtsX-like permease family protein [Lachnospiraceae bacterium]
MKILLRYIRRNMMERKGRLALMIISIALSTGLLVACLGMINTIKDSITEPARKMSEGKNVELHSCLDDPYFTKEDFQSDKLTEFSGELQTVGVKVEDDKLSYVVLRGRESFSGALTGGEWKNSADPDCVISERMAKEWNVKAGDKFEIMFNGEPLSLNIKAVAVNDGMFYGDTKEQFYMVISYTYLNDQLGAEGKYNAMYAKITGAKDKLTSEEIEDAVKKFNEANTAVKATAIDTVTVVGNFDSLILGIGCMFGIVVVVSGLIISGVFRMIISERLPVLGTFMSQGASKGKVSRILILESALYGLLGGIVGAALGEGILYLVGRLVSPLADYGIYVPFEIEWVNVVAGIAFAIMMSAISSWLAVRRIRKLQTKDVILNRVEHTGKRKRFKFYLGAVMLTVAAIGNAKIMGTVSALSLLYLVISMVGIILVTPTLVRGITGVLAKIFRKNTTMFLALNNIRTSRLLINNIVLLVMAVSSVLTVAMFGSSMVDACRDAYTEFDFDYGISVSYQGGGEEPISDAIVRNLKELDCVKKETISSVMYGVAEIDGKKIVGLGVDPEPYRDYNDYIELDKCKEYDTFINSPDDEIIITKVVARNFDLKVGDTVKVKINDIEHEQHVCAIVNGKLYDSGEFILIANDKLKELYHVSGANEITFKVTGDMKEAEKQFKAMVTNYGATYVDRDTMCEQNIEQNDMIVKLIQVFAYLTMIIASIGIFNNIVISFRQRSREFAVLASVGMTGSARKRLILAESILCVIISLLITLPYSMLMVGVFSTLMYYVGMEFDVLFSWGEVPMYAIAILVIVTIASLSTMRKSRKLSVVAELKYE